ncbi:protein TonB [Sphingobium sp. OAS761]|uniref:energy transducer TonB family protein n=1 Tax=Sphingobium sp. OAS761 TaxID=2817901 RepID=UPI0020A0A884|nr:energy transducer TonB [Sphingobium sp. OAS761]MCP1469669.1 protein TonB [Sphingobium sp. OAS761]
MILERHRGLRENADAARGYTAGPGPEPPEREPRASYRRAGGYLAASQTDSRIKGALVTLAVHLFFVAAFFIQWGASHIARDAPALTVFDVAPPAAPPKPESERPQGPEQIEQPEAEPSPRPEPPRAELPNIVLPIDWPAMASELQPAPQTAEPAERTSAPSAKPLPPAPRISTGRPTWEGMVLAALDKAKRYPRDAQFARQQGVPWIRFVIDRQGRVLSSRLERSSGYASLDREAVALPRRAEPLPSPPATVGGDTIELVVPVEFFMKGR